MDDQKYINAYIDTTVGAVHEYINIILQLKAKIKVASDLVLEKDEVIATLQNQLNENKQNTEEVSNAKRDAKSWEEQYHAMKSKVAHMDTLTNQYNELKKQFIETNSELDKLRPDNERLLKEVQDLQKYIPKEPKVKTTKKAINTKQVEQPVVIPTIKDENDDF